MIPSIDDLDRRGIQYTVRTHRIETAKDAAPFGKGRVFFKASARAEKIRVRNARWAQLEAQGWSRSRIAKHYRTCVSHVSKQLGPLVPGRVGRPPLKRDDRGPVEVRGKKYRSDRDARRALKIGYSAFALLVEQKKARYL